MKDLEVLIKSKTEIENLGLKKLVNLTMKGLGRGKWKRKKLSGKYAIIINNVIIEKRFNSVSDAREFGVWNYKGRKDFSVVNLSKL